MQIHREELPAGLLLRLDGQLDAAGAPLAEPVLFRALLADELLVLDLARLRACSPEGVRLLLRLLQQAKAKRARLGFAAMQPAVQEVLETNGVDRMMRIFPTTGAAAKALG